MKTFFKFLTNIGSLALVCAIVWLGWKYLGPVRPQVSDLRKQVALEVMPELIDDISKNRGEVRSAYFIHLAGDPGDFISTTLRNRLELAGTLDLGDRTLTTKVKTLLNLPIASAANLPQALEFARKSKSQAVLFGTVNNFEETKSEAILNLDLTLATLPEGRIVWKQRYTRREAAGLLPSVQFTETATGEHTFFSRLLCWGLLALLLPVFSIQFLRMMLRKKSNGANAAMLLLYTVVDAMLAVLLLTGTPSTWPVLLIFSAIIIAAFMYNVWIMTFALALDE